MKPGWYTTRPGVQHWWTGRYWSTYTRPARAGFWAPSTRKHSIAWWCFMPTLGWVFVGIWWIFKIGFVRPRYW